MTSRIAHLQHIEKTGRLVVSLEVGRGDTLHRLLIDEVTQPGRFIETGYGHLYQHTDGGWGWPGASFGTHAVAIQYRVQAPALRSEFWVDDPPSTFGTEKIAPADLVPHLWAAGFRTEAHLTNGLAIAAGESGYFVRARNWLPSSGFRPAGTVIGVEGPAAAWNHDHTQQGHSDRGLYQINTRFHFRFDDAQCDDPAEAAKVLWSMTGGGVDWRAWGWAKPIEEHYAKHFPAARTIVQAFLAAKS